MKKFSMESSLWKKSQWKIPLWKILNGKSLFGKILNGKFPLENSQWKIPPIKNLNLRFFNLFFQQLGNLFELEFEHSPDFFNLENYIKFKLNWALTQLYLFAAMIFTWFLDGSVGATLLIRVKGIVQKVRFIMATAAFGNWVTWSFDTAVWFSVVETSSCPVT